MEELLIKLVKEQPMLYERQRVVPKDATALRTEMWNKIDKKMAAAGYDLQFPVGAKKNWLRLRDRFVHAVKRFNTRKSCGLEKESQPSWRLYKQMKWLIPHCNMRDRPNTRKAVAEAEATSIPNIELDSALSETSDSPPPSTPIAQPAPIPIPVVDTSSSTKRRRHTEVTTSGNLGVALSSDFLVNKQRDDSLVFGKMVEAQHRLLSPAQRQFFLHKVQAAYMQALTYKGDENIAESESTCYLD